MSGKKYNARRFHIRPASEFKNKQLLPSSDLSPRSVCVKHPSERRQWWSEGWLLRYQNGNTTRGLDIKMEIPQEAQISKWNYNWIQREYVTDSGGNEQKIHIHKQKWKILFSLKTRPHERWLDKRMAGRWQLSSVGRGKTTIRWKPRQDGQGSQAREGSKAWLQNKEKMKMGMKTKRRKKRGSKERKRRRM